MAIPRYRYAQKKKRKGGRFQRGFYIPINEEKYIQPPDKTMNSQKYPEYRSSWEKAFYGWCDKSPDIEKWSTESVAIPYVSPKDGQVHRYFPDLFLYFTDGRKVIVEIKPKGQCKMPVNIAKWEQAEIFASKIGAKFVVITETELKAWGLIPK